MKSKQALTNETAKRYRTAGRKGKTKILDEFVENTGYCRKYALHILANWEKMRFARLDGERVKLKAGKTRKRKKRAGKPVYTPQDIEALKAVWDFFWQPCGKLTAPLLRAQMDFLVSVPAFGITDAVRADLLAISPATIDRKLREEKKRLAVRGISGTKPGA
ncbi:MAG: transposase, partial [Treponema sp.]|nr:transposase [Treponema sp.]